jgi:peptidoglycan/LPS O-acetylase OafA/YrhL
MSQNQYRPDIDGLRAIAVLSVLLHHLTPNFFPGGFVGVDIFFVISGYLITSQVYQEASAGSFSLKHFYKRRINRIVPALVAMVTATLLAGLVLLSPSDLKVLAKSAIYTIFGLPNIFFWREYTNYFAGNAAEAPLLHTWSLGVEEQFYMVWPIGILLLLKLFGARYRLGVLVLALVAMVAISEAGTRSTASYYLLPTRFFELMIGGVLAIACGRRSPGARFAATLAALAGFGLIGGSFALLSKSSSFPGLNALWPCLGAALLIWAGTATPLSRLLTNRPMVFLGLISYSLYLWHWPIVAYLHYANVKITFGIGLAVALSSVLLAWLSWRFIETPMRKSGTPLAFAPVFFRRFALPAVAVVAFGVAAHLAGGFPGRFDSRVAEFEGALAAQAHVLRGRCHVSIDDFYIQPNTSCRLGKDKPQFDGILIGDSFANHFSGMVDVMAKAEGLSFMDYTMNGCPPILGYSVNKMPAYAAQCQKRNETAFAEVSRRHLPRVILAGHWPNNAEAGEKLITSVEALLKTKARLTIILNNQVIGRANRCPIQKAMYRLEKSCEVAQKELPEYFNVLRSRHPEIHFIDPNQVICHGGTCSPVVDDVLLYRDSGHLNDMGSRMIGRHLLKDGVVL